MRTVLENGDQLDLTEGEFRVVSHMLYLCDDDDCGFYHVAPEFTFGQVADSVREVRNDSFD